MRIVAPKPFMFEGGSRAVLLLHGFTGTTADVRMLGRYLQKKGYSCYAPLYKGHGVPPEELLTTGPADWWADVIEGYETLKEKGYEEIAVVGLSLGGVFTLKIGYTLPIKGLASMCAPIRAKTDDELYKGILAYARKYKELEKKSTDEIETEMISLQEIPTSIITELKEFFKEVYEKLPAINLPTFVVQARQDEVIDVESAQLIYDRIASADKSIKWYEESTHVITLGKEKEQLHTDVYQFLEGLNWTVG